MAEEVKVSLLEKSLSLSKNGGIYYGGARVEADERTAVLFVGLGGSGADALLRIKDQVKTRMILPADKTGAPVADQPKNWIFGNRYRQQWSGSHLWNCSF